MSTVCLLKGYWNVPLTFLPIRKTYWFFKSTKRQPKPTLKPMRQWWGLSAWYPGHLGTGRWILKAGFQLVIGWAMNLLGSCLFDAASAFGWWQEDFWDAFEITFFPVVLLDFEPHFCWKKNQFALVCWFRGWIFLQFLLLTSRFPSMNRFVPGSSGLSSWDMVAWIAGVGGLKCRKTSSQLIEGIFWTLSSSDFYFNYCQFCWDVIFWGKVCSVVFQDWVLKSQTSFDAWKLMSKSTRILGCGNILFLGDHFRV